MHQALHRLQDHPGGQVQIGRRDLAAVRLQQLPHLTEDAAVRRALIAWRVEKGKLHISLGITGPVAGVIADSAGVASVYLAGAVMAALSLGVARHLRMRPHKVTRHV